MKKNRLILSFIFVLLITCSMAVFPRTASASSFPPAKGSWQQLNNLPTTSNSDTALAVISGTPYIAYTNGSRIVVQKYDGSTWVDISLDLGGDPALSTAYPEDICLKAYSGVLYLAFPDQSGTNINSYICTNPGSAPAWTQLHVLNGSSDEISRLQLDVQSGTPYIAFNYDSSSKKQVYQLSGSGWRQLGGDNELPGADNSGLGFCAFGGSPYIAYKNASGIGIVNYYSGSSWQKFNTPGLNMTAVYQIAFDADGNLYTLCNNPSSPAFSRYSRSGECLSYALSGSFKDSAIAVHNNDIYFVTLNASSVPEVHWYNGKALYQLASGSSIPPAKYVDLTLDGNTPILSVTTASNDILCYKFNATNATLDASLVTVVNNPSGTADTVTVTGLDYDARICVYGDSAGANLLGTGYVVDPEASIHTATVSIPQLGKSSGSIYVSVCQNGYFEIKPVIKDYIGEPYTVSFDPQGGLLNPAVPNKTVYYDGTYGTLPVPAKTGYTFGGWFSAANGGGSQATESTIVSLSATPNLYAMWTANTYTVTYDDNGGDAGTTSASKHTYDTEKALTPNNYIRTGCIFAGWALTKDGPVVYGNAETVKNLTADQNGKVTLFAKWTKADFAITYYLNGGTPASPNPDGYNMESNTFTLKNPTKPGYIFAGWTGTGLGGPTVTVTIPKGSVGKRSYTATWTKTSYVIKAGANNKKYGTVTGARTYYGGDTVTLTAVPANGYLLQNWTEGKTKVSTAGVYTFTAVKARTLTANFAKIGTPVLSSVKASGKGSLTIAWKSVSGVKGYYVYRATSKSGKYAIVQTVSGALKFTDTKLTSGKTYYYKVQAYYTAGSKTTTGAFSKVLSAKVK